MTETIDLTKIEQRVVGSGDVKDFISSYHYSKKLGHTMLSLAYYYDEKLIGAITYGIGANSSQIKWLQKIDENLTQKSFFELTRLCIHPDYHVKNLASSIVARSFEYIKKNLPERKVLISYADTNQENESGVNHITVKVEQKQKYLYFLCDKKTKRRWMKRIPILPYPKQDKLVEVQTSKIFDKDKPKKDRGRGIKSDTPVPTGRAVRFRTPAPSSTSEKKEVKKGGKLKISKDVSILEQAFTLPVPEEVPILYENNKSKFVPGEGNKSADIMLVGQAPGQDEDRECRPFVGRAGQELRKCLADIGLDATKLWITNLVRQYPPQDREPKPAEVMAHMPYLIQEINEVKPKAIVLLGNAALQAFMNRRGITKARGNIYSMKFEFGEVKLIPVFHPSYVLRREDDNVTRIKFLKDLTMVKKLILGTTETEGAIKTKYVLVDTLEKFHRLMSQLHKAEIVDFDLETTHNIPEKGKIICMSFSINPYRAAVVPLWLSWKDGKKVDEYRFWDDKHGYVMAELKEFFESDVSKCAQAGHLIDIPFLRDEEIDIRHYEYDTIIMHHLLDENVKMENRGLKDFAWEYTDMQGYDAEIETWKEKLENQERERLKKENLPVPKKIMPKFANIPFDILWPYSAADADVLGRVRRIFWDKLKSQGLAALCKKISVPVQLVFCDIERDGIKIDREKLASIQEEYDAMEKDVDKQLASHYVTERTQQILLERAKTPARKKVIESGGVNYGSTQQIAIALFEVIGLTPTKKTDSGAPSTDEEVLTELQDKHEIPKLILQKRKYGYFKKYYGEKFEKAIREDGRIHTTYYVYGTGTGRPSSKNPNLNNIPRDDEGTIASRIRNIFVAAPGSVFIDADFSQIEYRLLANYTQDKRMLDDIANDRDIHVINASLIFEIPEGDVTPQQRQDAKGLTYLLIYGGTIYRIMSEFGVSQERAQEIFDGLFSRYPGAKAYHESTIDLARTKGHVQNIYGRRRRLPNILSENGKMRGHCERQAINAPIQGLASELLSLAMIRLRRLWREKSGLAKMVLTVYDSLTHECSEKDANKVIALIHQEMTRPMKGITVPLPIEVKIGKSLGSMKKLTPNELAKIVELKN